jgi:hypothetical protein
MCTYARAQSKLYLMLELRRMLTLNYICNDRIKIDEDLGWPVNLLKVKGNQSSEFNELPRRSDDGHPLSQSSYEGCGR